MRFGRPLRILLILTMTSSGFASPVVPAAKKQDRPIHFTFDKIDLTKVRGTAKNNQAEDWISKASARHARAYVNAPSWVRDLESRKVSDYFGREAEAKPLFSSVNKSQKSAIKNKQRKLFLRDALKLHQYFESQDEPELFKEHAPDIFKDFKSSLEDYILNVDEATLASELAGLEGPTLSDLSLGTFVAQRQIDYLYHRPNFVSNITRYFSGYHLRAASKYVAWTAFVAATTYVGHLYKINMVAAAFVGGMIIGGIKNGPVADLFRASFGWFTRPATEMIRVREARYTGKLEERMNNIADNLKSSDDSEAAAERNERPKIANLEEDGMDFAGMSEQDQYANWDKNLRMWVAVAKRFGQLLRDTHHSGRFLMMISWTDEQAAASAIETMATKINTIDLKAETVSAPFKTAFLIKGESEKKVQLERLYDEYLATCKSIWADLSLTEHELEARVDHINAIEVQLAALGLSERDLKIFRNNELERAKATGTLVTAVALNEMRAFNVAEANRNLEPEAREAQRATRFGFNLQQYVEDYKPLVQHQMRLMGFQHAAAPETKRKAIACPTVLEKIAEARP